MLSTTTEKTVDALRIMFAQYGLAEHLASDNKLQFTSAEFSQFVEGN